MQNITRGFQLLVAGDGGYRLQPVYNAYLVHEQKIKQPGEPTYSAFQFNNPASSKVASFTINLVPKKENDPDITFNNPVISINQQDALQLPIS